MKSGAPRRPYNSTARAAQKAETRVRILDVLAAQLGQGAFDSLSMEEIAAAAGVAPATLYRHFPSREALLDAFADEYFLGRLGDLPYPQTVEDIASGMQRSFLAFDADPEFVRLYFETELGRTARVRGRQRRVEAIQAALRPVTEGLEESHRRQAEAAIAYLASIQSWLTMRAEFGLTGAQVGQTVSWAINTLIEDLRKQQAARATPGSQVKGANDGNDIGEHQTG